MIFTDTTTTFIFCSQYPSTIRAVSAFIRVSPLQLQLQLQLFLFPTSSTQAGSHASYRT